jgi:sulfhydrogenase subunit beta (sulfur reductase)
MTTSQVPVGSNVFLEHEHLISLIPPLRDRGYRVIGPRVADGAIIYDDVSEVDGFPRGYVDEQDGGTYRLRREGNAYFDYVVGPHSLKNYLFPARETLLEMRRTEHDRWEVEVPAAEMAPLAVLGVRSCDLHAVHIQDRVFLEGPYVDPYYQARRQHLFLVAVNCRRAAATCFCHSMKTGPRATEGFDLSLTELDLGFVVQVGSERGAEILAEVPWIPCTRTQWELAERLSDELQEQMEGRSGQPASVATDADASRSSGPRGRHLDTTGIHDLLMKNLEHPHWQAVAERCLACANCTLVCPTCFCSTVEEVPDLTGDHVRRDRGWASCFMAEHSYMNSGTVRTSTHSRYRQWLTHKLATWWDQYDTSGCTGCGRCITWCPVGIDLTAEVAALRGATRRE